MGRPRGCSRTILAGVVALALAGCGGTAVGPSPSLTAVVAAIPSPSASAPESPVDQPSADLPTDTPADSPSDAPTDAPVDPCSLITRAEANAVAGTRTGTPMPAGDPVTRCVWPTPTSGAVGQVEIGLGDGAKKAFDIDKTVLKHKFAPVPGLGDEGWSEDGGVFFRTGDLWVAVNVVRLDGPKTWMPRLVALAKTVAGRI